MARLNRSPVRKLLAALFAVGLVALMSAPADAWGGHPVNQAIVYYMPGPPPGPPLSLCNVVTGLFKYQLGDQAGFLVLDNDSSSFCNGGIVQGVFLNESTGQLVNGPQVLAPDNVGVHSDGATGMPIFGSNLIAANDFGYYQIWQVTIL